jgi:ribosomal protein S18 acetylase RimI-like enzyme
VISLSFPSENANRTKAIRPVNLRTDMLQLAELMEVAFHETMDESSRNALRDMRRIGENFGMGFLSRLNELALGINKGFVWLEEGRIVGNVSIVPANWPSDLGKVWMIVNVAVYPNYRRQGIAKKLMQASIAEIERLGAKHVILQVDYDNLGAVELYDELGFVRERAFTTWIRNSYTHAPHDINDKTIFITHPRNSEWQAEYELAEAARPDKYGGIGWEKPLHSQYFRPSFWKRLLSLFTFSGTERLIVRDGAQDIMATLWIERNIALSRAKLIFMQHANVPLAYADALFNTVLRRFRTSGFIIEHPHDDTIINELLTDYRFRVKRTLWHMRYDL